MIGQITNTYQSLMDEIDKMNDKLDTALNPSSIKEEDDIHSKQMLGIKKLWQWFNAVDGLVPSDFGWSIPHKWESRQRIVTTGHIVRFLGDMIDKGFWSKEDRIILNYIRELYILNKGILNPADYITIITNKNFNSK
jgi:hypothetical protein